MFEKSIYFKAFCIIFTWMTYAIGFTDTVAHILKTISILDEYL